MSDYIKNFKPEDVLKSLSIHSSVEKFPCPVIDSTSAAEDFIAEKLSGSVFVIAWLKYAVICGRRDDNGWQWSRPQEETNWTLLEELRAFNESGELYLSEGYCRLRMDGDGDAPVVEAVDTQSRLWGEATSVTDEGFTVFEDRPRKISVTVPESLPVGRTAQLTVRNYIGYSSVGQAGYSDYRYVRISE